MHILFVDAGNYCRSPAAEAVARALAERAGLGARVSFGSAGLKDKHAGDTADPRTIEACAVRGYALGDFRCREITPADYAEAGLILAMDRENLAALEARRPAGNTTPIRLFLGEAEVPDPYFGEADGFALMMEQIEAGARALLAELARAD
ncbi:MAG: low molecular weight phosphotyrosine protein phosphatase [Xanthomonadales bacterium]|jgi:protein-tyrosine phosphatase|nr:low molecular weight phosphotyrosine protein phosphatase [Xanthomonadales bacterium]